MGDRLQAALSQAADPRTVPGLHAALKARVSEIVAGFDGLATKSSTRAPRVLDGWLPPKASAGAEDYPFILVRPSSGLDTEESADQHTEVKVKLIIGTYSDTDDGWLDLMFIVDAIRYDLGAAPVLQGTGFEQVGPLTWELPEEQPRPEWLATVTTNWILPRPRRVDARNAGEE